MRKGICSSATLRKPRASISARSRSFDLRGSPVVASCVPPSHLERSVYCSSQEKGVARTTTPPGLITAARPSRQASGSGSRQRRFASRAASKRPREEASSLSRQASPTRKEVRARAAASTFGSWLQTSFCRRSPSMGRPKRISSPRRMRSAASMKDSLKSTPSTSRPPAASSKLEPPTAQPRSSARRPAAPRPEACGSSESSSRAARCGKRSACSGAPACGRIGAAPSAPPEAGKWKPRYWSSSSLDS
mmetsp:Transcript_48714/g.139304  ORF Transcript_48714/g.139304 Transcript_48714/m.139304 type:complete len:248 (+) Transcript_48714:130-873(+)